MGDQLTFPVMIPRRPDGRGMIAQGGKVVDGKESGHIVPLFTSTCSPGAFLAGIGIPGECEMSAFDRRSFIEFLGLLIDRPEQYGVAGFVVDPANPDLKPQAKRTPAELLQSLVAAAG